MRNVKGMLNAVKYQVDFFHLESHILSRDICRPIGNVMGFWKNVLCSAFVFVIIDKKLVNIFLK